MNGMLPIHFIRPLWLLLVPLAVVLPLAWRHFRRPSGDWARVCDPHLLRWLSVGRPGDRPGRLGALFSMLALVLTAVALAGPSWQKLPDTSFSARDARVLVLDLSASMLAEDFRPNRLTQARFRLSDMLAETREGQMGLVAYAGDAYVVSPLTSDMNTIANMLPALQPDIMPVAGSRADRAMLLAAELLERAGMQRGEILLISDSADASDAATAGDLAGRGIRTSVLAVGTPDGAPIPSGNGFVSDAGGSVVITRLDTDALVRVAEAGGGRFSVLEAGGAAPTPWRDGDGSAFALRDDALGERWKDVGPWLVLLLLPAAAAGFRRGLLFVLPLVILPGMLASAPAQAGVWDDLWRSRDQQARDALEAQDAEAAAALAENPELSGEAWYRSGDYQQAQQAWSRAESEDAHYNRGNALARAGEFEQAIAAYDAALEQNPEMEDALFNRALVEELMKQQEQEQQQQNQENQGEQGEQSEQSESDSEQEGEESDQQDSESQEEQNEQQSQEQSEQEMEQTWSEEDAQAMEQWLRRIPDDPGGLLRRKFRSQHQRRGAPVDEERKW
ncbi:MAG: VWA domain-containing protein [Xanthomonadales bacterium]|nr:VWA domain-containing protein [Xanthomonadales bacterium]NIX11556.1 VWA domain-containing protein [Xanthomonadales bacterium]